MTAALFELAVIVLLVIANGLLAGSEIAVVSARKARLHQRAREGNVHAARALELASSPNRFLSTVQIGITAIAVVAGAFGGTRVAGTAAAAFQAAGVPAGFADRLALFVVVVGILFLTLVVGELVPKRIALYDPEGMAMRAAGPMNRLSVIATPLVRLLGFATDLVLRFVPLRERPDPEITEEEIKGMIAHATESGVLEATEQQILERLFRLSDHTIETLMTPRDRIVWIDRSKGPASWREQLGDVLYTRYVVADGSLDRIVGYVKTQDLLKEALAGDGGDLDGILRKPHSLPAWTPVFRMLELFQWSRVHIAVVTGREGRVQGVVTLNDVLEGIVGDIVETRDFSEPEIIRREDGSYLVDGLLPFDEFLDRFGRRDPDLPHFPTVHAFMVDRLGGEPRAAAITRWRGLRLEVVDMDATRVDKVLVAEDEPVLQPSRTL